MPTDCWLALHAASAIVVGRSTRSLDVMKGRFGALAIGCAIVAVPIGLVGLWAFLFLWELKKRPLEPVEPHRIRAEAHH